MRIVFVSDFSYQEIQGGAESNDLCLENMLKSNHEVIHVPTHVFNDTFSAYKDVKLYIISNFFFLSPQAELFMSDKNYIIIEHDYKFLRSRNPYDYPNFIANSYELEHVQFYRNARWVVIQSVFQLNIFKANMDLTNYYCFSGNLWSEEDLDLMHEISLRPKNRKVAVLKSDAAIKGTQEAINHCMGLGRPYDLIAEPNHNKFLKLLGQYDTLVFMPKSPETFSRICLEARMMGLTVITNDNVGVASEMVFSQFPDDIVNDMRQKKLEMLTLIEKCV